MQDKEFMNDNSSYIVYLNMVEEYLKARKKRLLTENEEEIVVAHLKVVAATYCNNPREYGGKSSKNKLGITQVLSIETAKKVSELHEDFPEPSPEEVAQRVAEVLLVQEYLRKNPKP